MAALTLKQPFHEAAGQIAIELPGATAIFTTRSGGSSEGPFASLNLGVLTDDAPDRVSANHRWLEQRFGVRLVYGHQVHGSTVRVAGAPTDRGAQLIEADAIATATAGLAPMVLAADCLPIVIAGGAAVVAVHAGWKGLASGVIGEAVAVLAELSAANVAATVGSRQAGGGDALRLQAAIGPGAGVCCYEVSEELHERFAGLGFSSRSGDNLDLKAIATSQLHAAGIDSVHDVGLCTICSPEGLFFSHRRDHGVTGRQGALAWLS